MPTIYLHTKHYSDLWEKKIETVFSDELHYKIEGLHSPPDCQYFENIYSKAQLINLFSITALRIFFLIYQKNIFFSLNLNKRRKYISSL